MEANDPSKVTTEGVQHQQVADPQAPMAAASIPAGFTHGTTTQPAGALPWLDPTTAAILLNPNTAATAFAAIAASAAQTVAQQQQQQQQQVHAHQHAAVAQAHVAQSAILAAQQHHQPQHQAPVTVQQQVLTAPAPGVPVLASAAVAPAAQAPLAAQPVAPQPAPAVPTVSHVVQQHQPVLPAATSSAPPPAQHQVVTAATAPAPNGTLAPAPQPAPAGPQQPQQQLVSVLPAAPGTTTPTTTVPFLNAAALPTTTYTAAPTAAPPTGAAPANSVLQVAAMMQAAAVAQQQQQQAQSLAATNANVFAAMQNWKLEQLEAHVQLLRETGRPLPPNVEMLLQEARRKEDKKTAKRVANRKSACTSRARKKALVEEMTRTNARLRRQALILALLPDLVIAITVDGTITFGSQQVERVLRHNTSDLIGANLTDLLVPECRQALHHLIDELVAAERAAVSGVVGGGDSPSSQPVSAGVGSRSDKNKANGSRAAVAGHSSATSSAGNGAAVVSSEASIFPLEVVKVENQGSGAEENSDLSTSNGGKGGSHASMKGSAASSFNEGENNKNSSGHEKNAKLGKKKKPSAESSDESFSSSLGKANENLSRNVRWHNEQMQSKKEGGKEKTKHRDDVTGASVTANNADARLSSLQHRPENLSPRAGKRKQESLEDGSSSSSDSLLAGVEEKKKGTRKRKARHDNSSDESGYRESNESSREETSSEDNDSSNDSGNGRRPKPLAPTCTVCLIRDDLSTIWCEVTSSIRTRSLKEENQEAVAAAERRGPKAAAAASKAPSAVASTDSTNDEIKELLLCLRPIRDGETTVDESLRFRPVAARAIGGGVVGSAGEASTPPPEPNPEPSAVSSAADTPSSGLKGPPKKRPIQGPSIELAKISAEDSDDKQSCNASKRLKKDHANESEKSVVESLMLMSNNLATPHDA